MSISILLFLVLICGLSQSKLRFPVIVIVPAADPIVELVIEVQPLVPRYCPEPEPVAGNDMTLTPLLYEELPPPAPPPPTVIVTFGECVTLAEIVVVLFFVDQNISNLLSKIRSWLVDLLLTSYSL